MATEVFTDTLVADVVSELAVHEPERGGALLGAGGLTHLLVPDHNGICTGASWDISDELTAEVQARELAGRGTLTGTIHTHPANVPDPSPQDLHATARLLDANPHLVRSLVCVVTVGIARSDDLPVGDRHRMSVHVMRRGHDGYRVARSTSAVRAIGAHLRAASPGDRPRPIEPQDAFRITIAGSEALAVPVGEREDGTLVAACFTSLYPLAGPILAAVSETEATPIASGSWEASSPIARQLAVLIRAALGATPSEAFDRTVGLTGLLADRHVVVAGAGSVGASVAEALVRAGVGQLTIIDPDTVTAPNLSRTIYTVFDLGESKVTAAARHMRSINPAARVDGHAVTLQHLAEQGGLAELLASADLVVAATDDAVGQGLLSHHAYHARVPLVACGLYRRAAAGEVVIVDPSYGTYGTPCWRCAIGDGAAERPDKDYGSGQLVAELALGPAIAVVAQMAALLAIGVLAGPDRTAGADGAALLNSGRTLGIIATQPCWKFFPKVFAGMDGHQFAPQSIWVTPQRDPKCSVCGERREPPLAAGAGRRLALLRSELSADTVGVP